MEFERSESKGDGFKPSEKRSEKQENSGTSVKELTNTTLFKKW
jgi:hypothetical protein